MPVTYIVNTLQTNIHMKYNGKLGYAMICIMNYKITHFLAIQTLHTK